MKTSTRPAKAGSKYDGILARFYDADHAWRDYAAQAEFVAALFQRLKGAVPRTPVKPALVCDLCCGSGSHALYLARRGFQVLGVDLSGELIRQARSKRKGIGLGATFERGDIFTLSRRHRGRFDGVLLLGWSVSVDAIFARFSELLAEARALLKPRGLFVFDAPMGLNLHSVSPAPLHYLLGPDLEGTLKIEGRADAAAGKNHFFYDWTLRRPGGAVERLRAQETLAVVRASDIFSRVRDFRGFKTAGKFRDYALKSKFRPGDKNLIVALRKD